VVPGPTGFFCLFRIGPPQRVAEARLVEAEKKRKLEAIGIKTSGGAGGSSTTSRLEKTKWMHGAPRTGVPKRARLMD